MQWRIQDSPDGDGNSKAGSANLVFRPIFLKIEWKRRELNLAMHIPGAIFYAFACNSPQCDSLKTHSLIKPPNDNLPDSAKSLNLGRNNSTCHLNIFIVITKKKEILTHWGIVEET